MLEKFQHAENHFENFKHAMGKSNEVKEIEKAKQSKYEINTNLPLARACRLKSDVHDPSSIMIEHPPWEEQQRIAMLSPPFSFLMRRIDLVGLSGLVLPPLHAYPPL